MMIAFALASPTPEVRGSDGRNPAEPVERFPIHTDGDHLIVPVKIEDQYYQFLVDTGSPMMIYDRTLRPLLGRPKKNSSFSGPGGEVPVELFEAPEAWLGSLDLTTSADVVCMDLSRFREIGGNDIRGIIGMAFLQDYVVDIDFDEARLSFLRGVPPGLTSPLLLTIPEKWRVPIVAVEVEGLGWRKFVIDTGYSGTSGLLPHRDFKFLRDAGLIVPGSRTMVTNVLRTKRGEDGWVRRFTLGPFTHENLSFGHYHDDERPILGLAYLSRFNMTLDFPREAVFLCKSRQFDRIDEHRSVGLFLIRREGRTLVEAVAEDRPAAKVGIAVGDELLSVDGDDVSSIRFYVLIHDRLARKSQVRLTLRRGDRVFDAVVTPVKTEGPEPGEPFLKEHHPRASARNRSDSSQTRP